MSVILTATWFPRGELTRLQRYLPVLQEIYDRMMVVFPPEVDQEIKMAVDAMPDVHSDIMGGVGSGRYRALELALGYPAEYVHYVDMDRLIRWVELYPDELRQTVEAIKQWDFTLIGRTETAFISHPQALQRTERIIHAVFSHIIGVEGDFCAGSKGFNRRAVEYIVKHGSSSDGLGTDTEWAVLLHRGGFSIGTLAVDGLDWETADRFQDAAADRKRQRAEADAYDQDSTRWQMRTELALKIIESGLKALERDL